MLSRIFIMFFSGATGTVGGVGGAVPTYHIYGF